MICRWHRLVVIGARFRKRPIRPQVVRKCRVMGPELDGGFGRLDTIFVSKDPPQQLELSPNLLWMIQRTMESTQMQYPLGCGGVFPCRLNVMQQILDIALGHRVMAEKKSCISTQRIVDPNQTFVQPLICWSATMVTIRPVSICPKCIVSTPYSINVVRKPWAGTITLPAARTEPLIFVII